MSGNTNLTVSAEKRINTSQRITNENEIKDLIILAELLEIYRELKNIDLNSLPDSAIQPLINVMDRCHKPGAPCLDFAVTLFIDALANERFYGQEKAKVDLILDKMRKVKANYLKLFQAKAAKKIYLEGNETKQPGSLRQRALNALLTLIVRRGLSKKISPLSIKRREIDALKDEELSKLIKDIRNLIQTKSKAAAKKQPAASQPAIQPKPSFFDKLDYSLRYTTGYGYREQGQDHPEILSQAERGVLNRGALSIRSEHFKSLPMQLDYRFSGPIDDRGDDNVISKLDDIKLSFSPKFSDKWDITGNIGGLFYNHDYPSLESPNINGLTQFSRVNWRPFTKAPFISFNLDEGLIAGTTTTVKDKDPSDFHFIKFITKGGVSFSLFENIWTLYGGGTFSYHDIHKKIGGYAGSTIQPNKYNEINLRYDYDDQGHSVSGRYYLNMEDTKVFKGAGVQVTYNRNLAGTDQIMGSLFGEFKVFSFGGNDFILQPHFGVGYANPNDPALNFTFGLGLRWGKLRSNIPSYLRPNNSVPLPEDQ